MLLTPFIRANKTEVIARLAIKNFHNTELIDQVLQLDDLRKSLQQELDELLAEANSIAKQIGLLFKEGKAEAATVLKARNSEIKEKTKELNQKLVETKDQLNEKLVEIPNLPHESVPPGKQASDNITVHEEGVIPNLPENAVPHWD